MRIPDTRHRSPPEIISHRVCLERFLRELPATLEEKKKDDPRAYEKILLVPPSRTVETNLTLELGGHPPSRRI